MIDLHMHTKHSDGTDSTVKLLEKAEKEKLEVISITDHNTVKAYFDIDKMNENIVFLYKGIIIKGCEFTTTFEGRLIEILGYHFNVKKINAYLKNYYSPNKMRQRVKVLKKRLYNILDQNHIIYDPKKIKIGLFSNKFMEKKVYEEIMRHEENKTIVTEDILCTFSDFYRKGLTCFESKFYINYQEFKPPIKEVIQAIHEAGGIAILAHPYQYKFTDTESFLDKIMALTKLDGVECFYTTFTEEQTQYLVNYCTKYNLLMAGGSDYHGKNKPDYKLGTGFGNLNISKNVITHWTERPKPNSTLNASFGDDWKN